jgi:hypothetical protein
MNKFVWLTDITFFFEETDISTFSYSAITDFYVATAGADFPLENCYKVTKSKRIENGKT